MKILLFGEFSGLHNNLKEGLLELGYQAFVVTLGDGFKKFETDLKILSTNNKKLFEKIKVNFDNYMIFDRFIKKNNFDIVQYINPFTSIVTPRFNRIFQKKVNELIFYNIPKRFLCVSGCDYYVYKEFNRSIQLKKLCKRCIQIDGNKKFCPFKKERAYNDYIVSNMNGIIPITKGAYYRAYKQVYKEKVLEPINIPINIDKITYKENVVSNKIKILHGINRVGFKGSDIIISALKKAKDYFHNDIEIIIVEKLPYKEYLKKLYESNIVIDQLYSDDFGLNSLFTMATGRVLLTNYDEKIRNNAPVLKVDDSEQTIVKQIEWLINNRNKISEMSYKSRKYIEDNFHYIKIAQKYLEVWKNKCAE